MDEDVILTLIEGEDYAVLLTLEEDDGRPISLDGYTLLESQIRKDFSHSSDVLASFSISIIGEHSNEISLSLSYSEIEDLMPTMSPQSSRGAGSFWDLFGVNPSGSRRLIAKGRVRFEHTITREGA